MPEVELERRDDGIAVLTLNAPERRNALTVAMAEALTAACEAIDADEAIGAVVVRGEGGYFCAGGDRTTLAEAGRDPAEDERYRGMSTIYRSFARVGELAPPTIAAIRGGALGAGLNLALATDLRVVADDADVGRQREVQAGADGSAADRGDRRRRELADPREAAVDRAHAAVALVLGGIAAGLGERRAVAARAEVRARAAHDHRSHGLVGVDLLARRGQRLRHRDGQRVAPLRRVQGQDRDPVLAALELDLRHGAPP